MIIRIKNKFLRRSMLLLFGPFIIIGGLPVIFFCVGIVGVYEEIIDLPSAIRNCWCGRD